jgi:hypothetical protein
MDIKVNDHNLTGAAAGSSARAENTQKAGSSPSSEPQSSSRSTAGDHVEFSGTLGRLSQALSNQGTQRAASVAALGAAYQSGNYVPNAAGASKGLISEGLSAAGGQ